MGPWRDDRPHSFNTVQGAEDDILRRTHRLAALRRSRLPQPPQTCVRTLLSRPYTQSVGQLTAGPAECQVSSQSRALPRAMGCARATPTEDVKWSQGESNPRYRRERPVS